MYRTIHMFDSSGDAYDACQCDPQVKKGDLLYIPSEGVVGIAGTWPLAVTHRNGKIHHPADHYFQSTEPGFSVGEIMEVVKFAKKVGLPIHRVFRETDPWALPNLMAFTLYVNNNQDEEGGQMTWYEFLTNNKDLHATPFEEVLHIYLNWALGPDWEQWPGTENFPRN